jgi:hypothetical protein
LAEASEGSDDQWIEVQAGEVGRCEQQAKAREESNEREEAEGTPGAQQGVHTIGAPPLTRQAVKELSEEEQLGPKTVLPEVVEVEGGEPVGVGRQEDDGVVGIERADVGIPGSKAVPGENENDYREAGPKPER